MPFRNVFLAVAIATALSARRFVLHAKANIGAPAIHRFDNFVYGAAPLAPLCFSNLAVPGLIALWRFQKN